MTLQVLDLVAIGATTGFTTFLAMAGTMRYMRRVELKRKVMVMEEMLAKMHEAAESEQQFAQIVEQFKRQQGQE